jgi:PKD domain-containing protein
VWSRSTIRRRTAALLCVGLLAAGLVASAAVDPAAGAGETAVVIHTADGDVSIGSAELENAYDIVDKTYTIRANDGTEDRLRFSGASIRRVLDLAGIDPGSVRFLETPRSDGTDATLSGDDLGPNPPFADGPPLVFVDGAAVRYLRPVRNATDSNAGDNLATQTGAPLEITTRTGNILNVRITAESTGPGKLSFEATASGALPGESIDFSWDFGDGTTGTGVTTKHQYTAKGTYRIVARAEGDQDSAGSSNILTLSVSPSKDDGDGPGNGSNHNGNALPDGPQFGDGHQASGQPHGGKTQTGDLESSESPEQPTSTEAVPAPAYGGDSTYPSYPSAPLPDPLLPQSSGALPDLKPEHTPPPPPTEPAGETVVGRLLSAETPVPAGVPAVPPSAAASAAGDTSTSAWTGTGLGVGALLLIGAGAALELRGIRGSFRMHP